MASVRWISVEPPHRSGLGKLFRTAFCGLASAAFLLSVLGLSSPVALAGQSAEAAKASARKAAADAKPKVSGATQRKPSAKARRTRTAAALGAAASVAANPSVGQAIGLHQTPDPLELKSSVALVLDKDTNEVLFSKNADVALPIASITKLMTSVVVLERGQDLDEVLTVSQEDANAYRSGGSRLAVGTRLTRREMLHLALMASENRAAHVLGRRFPGGLDAFVRAMNDRARDLGMADTRFVEPTGLSSSNRSTANDLATLVRAAHRHPLIREFSVWPEATMAVGRRQLDFRNTNGLVRGGEWDIAVQKTGYIAAAGRCVAMQAHVGGRDLIVVLLDSSGRHARIGDAERLRQWITQRATMGSPELGKSPAPSLSAG